MTYFKQIHHFLLLVREEGRKEGLMCLRGGTRRIEADIRVSDGVVLREGIRQLSPRGR
ncbi:hypothetical protein RUM43_003741, partial [Polyplax serrata]